MAKKKRTTKRARKPRQSAKRVIAEFATTEFVRPVISIDGDKFEMRVPEEMTFDEFAMQIGFGESIQEIISRGINTETLAEMQELVESATRNLLVDVPDEVTNKVTPGLYMKIHGVFNTLASATDEASASASASRSSPGANDSTEAEETA